MKPFPLSDVDECASDTGLCHWHADCANTVGSYKCNCRPGFISNGPHCIGKSFRFGSMPEITYVNLERSVFMGLSLGTIHIEMKSSYLKSNGTLVFF